MSEGETVGLTPGPERPRCPIRGPVFGLQCDLTAGHQVDDHHAEEDGRHLYWTPVPRDVLEAYRAGREDAAEAVWTKATELRGKPFRSGEVGIEYVNGMEDASEVARGGTEAAALEGVEQR